MNKNLIDSIFIPSFIKTLEERKLNSRGNSLSIQQIREMVFQTFMKHLKSE